MSYAGTSIGTKVLTTVTVASTSSNDTYITVTGTLAIPSAGEWMIVSYGHAYLNSPPSGVQIMGVIDLYNTTDASSVLNLPYIGMRTNPGAADDAGNFNWNITTLVSISAPKNYTTRVRSAVTSGSSSTGGCGSRGVGQFYAVRIS